MNGKCSFYCDLSFRSLVFLDLIGFVCLVGLVKWDLVDFVFFSMVVVDGSGYLYISVVCYCYF